MKTKIFVLVFAIVLFIGISYFLDIPTNSTKKSLSYISININPDVQLAINENNIVEEVIALNEDAEILVSDLELVGTNALEAVDKIVDTSVETGYIDEFSDENDVVVTVMEEDEENRKTLETKVVDRINQRLVEKKVYAVVLPNGVSKEIKDLAEQYDISNGKMLLVTRALSLNPELNRDELAEKSVKDIQAEIKEIVTKKREALKLSKEEFIEERKQEKEKLKETYRNKIKAFKEDVLEKSDIDYDDMSGMERESAIEPFLEEKKEEIKEKVERYKKIAAKEVEKGNRSEAKDTIKEARDRIKRAQERGA